MLRWAGVIDRGIMDYDCVYEIDVLYLNPLSVVLLFVFILRLSQAPVQANICCITLLLISHESHESRVLTTGEPKSLRRRTNTIGAIGAKWSNRPVFGACI